MNRRFTEIAIARIVSLCLAVPLAAGGCNAILGIRDLDEGDSSTPGADATNDDAASRVGDAQHATDAEGGSALSEAGEPGDGPAPDAGTDGGGVVSEAGEPGDGRALADAEDGSVVSEAGEPGDGRALGADAADRGGDAGQSDADASGSQGGACTVNATRCEGTVEQTCEADGGWSTGAVTKGTCGAQCTPGSTAACNGAVPQSCSAAGILTTGAVTKGTCGAQCTPGSTAACNGAVPQSCSAAGVLTTGTVAAGTCGAVCTPGAFQCGPSQVGQECGAAGAWGSNNSSDACGCYVPGRFTEVSPTLAKDTTTGLIWDRFVRAADTWTNAQTICAGAGLRLPTRAEWQTVVIVNPSAGTDDGANGCASNPTPFDQAAMPTTAADIGCSGSSCDNLWTSETALQGDAYVSQLFPIASSGGNWDDESSFTAITNTAPYRCVE